MSQSCAIKDCKRASRTLCHCCDQNLCRDHFNEHDDLLNSQLNPFTDDINALSDRLTAINIDEITNNSRRKLNQWRLDCHQIIDRFYEEKCQELDQYVNKSIDEQRKEIVDLRSKMTKLIEKQETTKNDISSLTSAIRDLKEKMNEIEHIRVQVDIRSLTIDSSLIQIGEAKLHQFNLLNLPPPYRTIKRGFDSYNELTSSDRFLLTHVEPNLCLIDENLSVIKQIEWTYAEINDMCWSSVLGRFVVTTDNDVLSVHENTMSIQQVQQIESDGWCRCGCSDKSLYLSRNVWDSALFEFSLLPTIRFVKVWKTNKKLKQEQRVDAIACSHGTLALAINDKSTQTKLMELRSSESFSTLWSIKLDVNYNKMIIRCCLLNHDEWLVADWSASRLFHISSDGKLKEASKCTPTPYHMTWFRPNTLVILTDDGVNLHKL